MVVPHGRLLKTPWYNLHESIDGNSYLKCQKRELSSFQSFSPIYLLLFKFISHEILLMKKHRSRNAMKLVDKFILMSSFANPTVSYLQQTIVELHLLKLIGW